MSIEFSSLKDLPGPSNYLPPDNADDDDATDARLVDYSRTARTVPTDDLMLAVSAAFSDADVLRRLVDDIKRTPFTPGERRHLHISDCLALGDVLATLIDAAMDDAVGMRAAAATGRAA